MMARSATKFTAYLSVLLLALAIFTARPGQASSPSHASGASEGGGEGGELIEEGPSFVQMDAVTVSVIRQGKVRGFLTVAFSLELEDYEGREQLSAISPRLEAEYHRDISDIAARNVDLSYPVDIMLVKRRLQATTDRVLGPRIAEVLMGSASIQRR